VIVGVASEYAALPNLFVVRLTDAGALDTTFGAGGAGSAPLLSR